MRYYLVVTFPRHLLGSCNYPDRRLGILLDTALPDEHCPIALDKAIRLDYMLEGKCVCVCMGVQLCANVCLRVYAYLGGRLKTCALLGQDSYRVHLFPCASDHQRITIDRTCPRG